MGRLILKTAFFTLIAPGMLTVAVPYLLLPPHFVLLPRSWSLSDFIGVALIISGLMVYLSCARDFISTGKGTPAPYDPPVFLVKHGLYRVTRNPMYVGVSAVIIGEAVFFKSFS